MSAAARGAAGWMYLTGRLARGAQHRKNLKEAEDAAEALKREREAKEKKTNERRRA